MEVWVEISGAAVRAGTLYAHRRREAESATFQYVEAYLALPEAYPLDPTLPLASGPFRTPTTHGMFNAFRDSSPDRWGRELIKRNERRAAESQGRTPRILTEVEFLLGVRDDLRQGAVRFRVQGEFASPATSGVPTVADLPDLLDASDRIGRDEALQEDLLRMIRAGSSLGGARPKVHIRTQEGITAIAKFPAPAADRWNVMAWEKVALDMAAEAGIDVPPSHLVEVGDHRVLVVERFDRNAEGERIGFWSGVTLLESQDGMSNSYVEVAERIEEESPAPTDDLRQLWRRIAFNILISNTDDHLRNHAFLRDSRMGWRLSPAFDMNPNPDPRRMATPIDDGVFDASPDVLVEVAPVYFRLSESQALGVLREVSAVVDRWQEFAERLGGAEIDMMRTAFVHSVGERIRHMIRT
ncbi:MAG: type II toxin-antitoxin system HipA family toxin [Acidimicrobiia bacterium]